MQRGEKVQTHKPIHFAFKKLNSNLKQNTIDSAMIVYNNFCFEKSNTIGLIQVGEWKYKVA